MDRISKEVRSRIMSRIRGRNTSPEIKLRKALYEVGLRGYRVHYKISGKPDVVFLKKKIAIFIDGDFWHGFRYPLWKEKWLFRRLASSLVPSNTARLIPESSQKPKLWTVWRPFSIVWASKNWLAPGWKMKILKNRRSE